MEERARQLGGSAGEVLCGSAVLPVQDGGEEGLFYFDLWQLARAHSGAREEVVRDYQAASVRLEFPADHLVVVLLLEEEGLRLEVAAVIPVQQLAERIVRVRDLLQRELLRRIVHDSEGLRGHHLLREPVLGL